MEELEKDARIRTEKIRINFFKKNLNKTKNNF